MPSPPPFTRRTLLALLNTFGLAGVSAAQPAGLTETSPASPPASPPADGDWQALSPAQWKARLSPAQFRVLREAGTEPAGTSPLNAEKRKGQFQCAGCALPLFASEAKYESGTGWPSFFAPLPGAVKTKTDYKLIFPRTEYHCARCGGHQGHVFDDGPKPTGQRYCNNGVALVFVPAPA